MVVWQNKLQTIQTKTCLEKLSYLNICQELTHTLKICIQLVYILSKRYIIIQSHSIAEYVFLFSLNLKKSARVNELTFSMSAAAPGKASGCANNKRDCILYFVHCLQYIVYCTICILYTVYIVHFKMSVLYYTLYSVHWTSLDCTVQ